MGRLIAVTGWLVAGSLAAANLPTDALPGKTWVPRSLSRLPDTVGAMAASGWSRVTGRGAPAPRMARTAPARAPDAVEVPSRRPDAIRTAAIRRDVELARPAPAAVTGPADDVDPPLPRSRPRAVRMQPVRPQPQGSSALIVPQRLPPGAIPQAGVAASAGPELSRRSRMPQIQTTGGATAAVAAAGGSLHAKIDLPMRSGPAPEKSVVSVLDKAEAVEVLGKSGAWTRVRSTRSGRTGWVLTADLDTAPVGGSLPPPEVMAIMQR
ncbi:SH3 domain-containing protein [Mangrovibrevibacter kandeliae]|uniref:SH3 domain-containing protein n=1 Tax=Mangrovibrevibacter kandeliae TaxID=2968473 RepID=UPI0021199A18|nr:SH3 domain-containing protein [Aurantimonas sp. CSK15Z-1]MCQ8783136.1 SH3 domain-containing protein [Aurantimonas sp. CSK15Z-1]